MYCNIFKIKASNKSPTPTTPATSEKIIVIIFNIINGIKAINLYKKNSGLPLQP